MTSTVVVQLPPPDSRYHLMPSTGWTPTTENWHPNEPLAQLYSGILYWLCSATFVFVDGRRAMLGLAAFSGTLNEARAETLRLSLDLPPLKLSDLINCTGSF